ncbi:MAG: hypothetical protein N2050_02880 [Flavobacteriales bacterium]|nr:hypothetical protein [Flavobacteriales bacterium]MCX7649484.1 hypothetical protein [Flavobacteriales bacterium]MDW8431811.1 hypothetical protein [Flavobacteriales bacterium]
MREAGGGRLGATGPGRCRSLRPGRRLAHGSGSGPRSHADPGACAGGTPKTFKKNVAGLLYF